MHHDESRNWIIRRAQGAKLESSDPSLALFVLYIMITIPDSQSRKKFATQVGMLLFQSLSDTVHHKIQHVELDQKVGISWRIA